jgi:hypothetical protein
MGFDVKTPAIAGAWGVCLEETEGGTHRAILPLYDGMPTRMPTLLAVATGLRDTGGVSGGVESKKPEAVEAAAKRNTARKRLFDPGGRIGGRGPGGRNAGLALVVAVPRPRAGVLPGPLTLPPLWRAFTHADDVALGQRLMTVWQFYSVRSREG